MTRSPSQNAVLRTLVWAETLGYAPTRAELMLTLDFVERGTWNVEHQNQDIDELIVAGTIAERMGRVGFSDSIDRIVETIRERDIFQPRKRRAAGVAARWLARLAGVRFVALANTTALGHARDEGDLDFFVVARAGTIWTTRLFSVFPFRLLGMTPKGENDRDAICLSYFVTDDALDFSTHQLAGDDPYFRHWFLSLLPLYDDGVSRDLWNANATLRERHPSARRWIVPPDLRIETSRVRIPTFRFLEPYFRSLQMKWFPPAIRERMNRDTTVIVNDHALKFHVTDGREAYRRTYFELCQKREIEP